MPRLCRANLWHRLFFLVLVALLSLPTPASATLSNSFCASLDNLQVPGSPMEPNVNGYTLTSTCLVFYNATTMGLSLKGNVLYKNVYIPATDTICPGNYYFAQGQKITFDNNLKCITATSGAAFSYCWACAQFSGTYIPFFNSIATPMNLTIAPDASQPKPYLWGDLPYSLSLNCNSTSCGSASDVIPPAPLPANASYVVRRPQRNLLALDTCFDRCFAAWARPDIPERQTRLQCRYDCNPNNFIRS